MKENKTSIKERLLAVFGVVVIAAVILGALVGGVYWLTGVVSSVELRWWAVLATLALPVAVAVTWALAHTAAREHLAGFDRGLLGAENTIASMGRGMAAVASLARTTAQQQRQPQVVDNSDLLPPARFLPPQHDGGVVDL